jgi:hypothetical protein
MTKPLRAIAALVAALATSSLAHAQADDNHPRVRLQVHSCTGTSENEVRHLVGLELGALLTDESVPGEVTEVSVSCERQHVWLRVDDPITGKALTRVVDLSSDPVSARARLVALAATELVVASWTELETNPSPQVPPAGPRPSDHAVAAARKVVGSRLPKQMNPKVEQMRLLVVASRRSFFSEQTALWGGGVRVGRDEFSVAGWTADLLAEHGETEVSLGRVTMDTFTVGGSLYLYRRWAWATFQLGFGIRVGMARLSGETDESVEAQTASGIAPWGWPTANGGLRIEPYGPLIIEAAGETGYVVLPMSGTVDGRREYTVDGLWLGAQLGIGLVL